MAKMYFVETNGGFMTVATATDPEHVREDDRACYMWQDGHEENYPLKNPRWYEAGVAEREEIATAWLEQLSEVGFDELYANCDCDSGFCGVYTSAEFVNDLARGDEIIAEIDFE